MEVYARNIHQKNVWMRVVLILEKNVLDTVNVTNF